MYGSFKSLISRRTVQNVLAPCVLPFVGRKQQGWFLF